MTASFAKTPRLPSSDPDICIIGNLTVDIIMRGIEEMPLWGQEVLSSARTESAAGQAAGMAFACATLGARTEIVAEVGEDESGARIQRDLKVAGVGVGALGVVAGGTTPLTIAVVRGDGERAFISDLGNESSFDIAAVVEQHPDVVQASVLALVGTSNLPGIDLDVAAHVLGRARSAGALTVFDSGWDQDGWSLTSVTAMQKILAETDLYLPNLDEARALTGRVEIEDVLNELGALCPGVVIVKAGEVGSYVAIDDGVALVGAVATVVDNAVGAGDVYNAGVVVGYLRGRDVLASMALGSAAASLYVSRRIDRFPKFKEVESLARQVPTSIV